MESTWVGIDMGKRSFTAWVAGGRRPLATLANTQEGFEQLGESLDEAQAETAVRLVVEPTGGYEAALVRFALERGFGVSLVNPARVREWARSEGRRAKTDRQDARMLADYGADKEPPPWRAQSEEMSELDSLLRRRVDLEGMLRQEKNRKEALEHRVGVAGGVPKRVDRLIETLERELGQIQGAIQELQAEHTELESQAELLDSVPGVGEKTVLPLLVLLDRWQTLTQGPRGCQGPGGIRGPGSQALRERV